MIPPLAWPLLTLLVLPLGWIEFKLLEKTRWGILLALLTVAALYGPWVMAIRGSPHRFEPGLHTMAGLGLALVALYLWAAAAPLILRDRGQIKTMPQALVTAGPYRWTRHPLYVGHVLFIGGAVLASGAWEVFLMTPILWVIAAITGSYEERSRLQPLFGETFRLYQEQTPLLLPKWTWVLWGIIYGAVLVRTIFGSAAHLPFLTLV